jgi:hypothetical protein
MSDCADAVVKGVARYTPTWRSLVRPNPSLNHRTRYGKHRKPGPRHMVHHREPGLRRLPPQAG